MSETSERSVLPPYGPPLGLAERVDPRHAAPIFAVAGWNPEWHRHSLEMMDARFGEPPMVAR